MASSALLNYNASIMESTNFTDNVTLPSSSTTEFTFPDLLYSPGLTGIFAIMAGVTSLFTTTGNILVVISFIVEANLRQPANYLIASLAVTDILIGMFSMPFYSLYLLKQYWPLGQTLCDLWLSMDYAVCLVSQYTVFLITLDRFCSVKIPTKYRNWRTKRKIKVMIAITWLFPTFIFFTSIMGWRKFTGTKPPDDYSCAAGFQDDKLFTVILVISYYWVTLVVMFGMYIGIYQVAWSLHARAKAKRSRMSQMKRLTNNNNTNGAVSIGESQLTQTNGTKTTSVSDYRKCKAKNGSSKLHEKEDTSDYSNDPSSSNSSCGRRQEFNEPERQSASNNEQADTFELDTTLSESPLWKPRSSFESESIHWEVFNEKNSSSCNGPEGNNLITGEEVVKVEIQDVSGENKPPESKDKLSAQFLHPFRRLGWCRRLKSNKSPIKKTRGENRARKALRTISFILGAFVVCWTPYHVVTIVYAFCPTCIDPTFYAFTYWLCYMNSPLNPFCYALSNIQFKTTFIRIIKGQCSRNRSYYRR